MIRFSILVCLYVLPVTSAAQSIDLQLPDGFTVTRVAQDQQATNIYCMATGPDGSVFVSGPGYIRKLNDADGDGVFESAHPFADFPKSGAQGMWVGQSELLVTGDQAIWRLSDQNHDGQSDHAPEKLIPIKTGGEHTGHAIRPGPDGWWYILAGNDTPILETYYNSPFSPIKNPRAGFLMRLSPDFRQGEVMAHGFRNAYDFAFDSEGQIFVYDSDGERDISLPWYRPTRVFRIQPGDDAGWFSRGWKRPDYFFDMPETVGAFGRGSPTGVVNYQSNAFPAEYHDALFVADWTFGRIHVLKKNSGTGKYDRGEPFAVADGQFGFAVTDLSVDCHGNLLVSVGGRGTSGSIYRISYTEESNSSVQPRQPALRLRPPFVKRGAWSRAESDAVLEALESDDPGQSLVALESLVGRMNDSDVGFEHSDEWYDQLTRGLTNQLAPFDGQRFKLVYRILETLPREHVIRMDRGSLPTLARLLVRLALLNHRVESPSADDREAARMRLLESVVVALRQPGPERLEICRLGQLALGGVGLADSHEMFKGYTATEVVQWPEESRNRVITVFVEILADSSLDEPTANEIGRLAAMLQMGSDDLAAAMLRRMRQTDSPVDQIHWTICLAQTGVIPESLAPPIAATLVATDQKIEALGMQTDRNWIPRMRELVETLFQVQPAIAAGVAKSIDGRASQVYLFDELPDELKALAIPNFLQYVNSEPDNVTADHIRVLAEDPTDHSRETIRAAASRPQLADAAILALTTNPQPEDRVFFRRGLLSKNETVMRRSATALLRFTGEPNADELLPALKVVRRGNWTNQTIGLRDDLAKLLIHQLDASFDYDFRDPARTQSDTIRSWEALLQNQFPDEYRAFFSEETSWDIDQALSQVDWSKGDAGRGEMLFRSLKCAQCHDGGTRLGPRLEGISRRFNRDDLFKAIAIPSEQVPDRYRATLIETIEGRAFTGSIVYESVDGITLQDVDGVTIRINRDEIESKRNTTKSLMPEGLLDGVTPAQLGDLYAYLRQL